MNKIKELIISANLNFKKEVTFNIAVNVALIGGSIFLFIFSKNITYIWPCLIFIIIFNVSVLYRYTLIKSRNEEKEIKDVKKIISFLYLNINKGETIERSFNNLKSVVSLKSIEYINDFLTKIKKKDDLTYYLEFAKKFTSINLVSLMSSLYRYKNETNKDNLSTINEMIFELENSINSKKIENSKFELIKASPLLGAFIAVLIFVLSIVLITGNYIHG